MDEKTYFAKVEGSAQKPRVWWLSRPYTVKKSVRSPCLVSNLGEICLNCMQDKSHIHQKKDKREIQSLSAAILFSAVSPSAAWWLYVAISCSRVPHSGLLDTMYACVWFCMTMYDYVWLSMTMYD